MDYSRRAFLASAIAAGGLPASPARPAETPRSRPPKRTRPAPKKVAVLTPQPEVQIRGDGRSNYEGVGRVVYACQRAGIAKVSFITEPPPRAAL